VDTNVRLVEDATVFSAQLNNEREQFQREVRKMRSQVEAFIHYGLASDSEMEEVRAGRAGTRGVWLWLKCPSSVCAVLESGGCAA
jgi:hypothetical protein